MTTAAFCGSFDPPTLGHLDLISRASALYDEVYVFIADNSAKHNAYSSLRRKEWLIEASRSLGNVKVEITDLLAVQAAKKAGASVLIRGLRNETDLAYEANMAWMNDCIDSSITTMCLFCRPEYAYISSSNVRELTAYHQSIEGFVPRCVFEDLQPEFAFRKKTGKDGK